MLGHALCRSNSSSEKSALAAKPQIGSYKLEEILHWTFRAPVVLGGVEVVYREGKILNLVQYSGD